MHNMIYDKASRSIAVFVISTAVIFVLYNLYILLAWWNYDNYSAELFWLLINAVVLLLLLFLVSAAYNVNPVKWADLFYYLGMMLALFLLAENFSNDRDASIRKYLNENNIAPRNNIKAIFSDYFEECKNEKHFKFHQLECVFLLDVEKAIENSTYKKWSNLSEQGNTLLSEALGARSDEHDSEYLDVEKVRWLIVNVGYMKIMTKNIGENRFLSYSFFQFVHWPKVVVFMLSIKLVKTLYELNFLLYIFRLVVRKMGF